MDRKNGEMITDAELLAALAHVAPQDRDLVLTFARLLAEGHYADLVPIVEGAKALVEHAKARMAKIDTREGGWRPKPSDSQPYR